MTEKAFAKKADNIFSTTEKILSTPEAPEQFKKPVCKHSKSSESQKNLLKVMLKAIGI